MRDPLLGLAGVSCRYRIPGGGFRTSLRDVSLAVRPGERLAVIGRSGAGKTTLASVMAGVLEPYAGRVERGEALAPGGRSLPVGLVTQNPEDTFTSPLVREEMSAVLENLGWEADEADRAVDGMLARSGLAEKAASPPSALSGGQKQILAAASILIASPLLLLLDEPLSLLDARARDAVGALLNERSGEGATVLFSAEVMDVTGADRVVVLHEGAVAWQGGRDALPLREDILSGWGLRVPDLTRLAGILGTDVGTPRLWTPRRLAEELCP